MLTSIMMKGLVNVNHGLVVPVTEASTDPQFWLSCVFNYEDWDWQWYVYDGRMWLQRIGQFGDTLEVERMVPMMRLGIDERAFIKQAINDWLNGRLKTSKRVNMFPREAVRT